MVNLLPHSSDRPRSRLPGALRLTMDRDVALRGLGSVWTLLFNFEGRIGRLPFWLGLISVLATTFAVERWLAQAFPANGPLLGVMAGALAVYPISALATKRGVDRGHGESWGVVLLLLIIAEAAVAGFIGQGPFAALASFCALSVWVFALADLGLLPAQDAPEAVGEGEPR